jgi:hypothetical protein
VPINSESQGNFEALLTLPTYAYSNFSPTAVLKYIRFESEANKALENINGPLGFDIEWKVMYRKAMVRPVAVVQVASERSIYIIQTSAMRGGEQVRIIDINAALTFSKYGSVPEEVEGTIRGPYCSQSRRKRFRYASAFTCQAPER